MKGSEAFRSTSMVNIVKTLASKGPRGDPIAMPSVARVNFYEQTDGVAMRSPLGPLLANVFMCSIEDKLDQDDKLPSYYRRYVDDTFTIMPDMASAGIFLDTLNHRHPSVKFTMEVERNASLPFIGVELDGSMDE